MKQLDAETIDLMIHQEVYDAMQKHPKWPNDISDQMMIFSEEVGEAIRAAVQYKHERGDIEEVQKELIQSAAMIYRILLNIHEL